MCSCHNSYGPIDEDALIVLTIVVALVCVIVLGTFAPAILLGIALGIGLIWFIWCTIGLIVAEDF